MVLSANYEARAFGIEGGMPSSRARRLCPQAVAVPPDFDTYGEVSAGIVAVFESVTAHVESASIDEAYLDVTGSVRALGSPRAIGEHLRALVEWKRAARAARGQDRLRFAVPSSPALLEGAAAAHRDLRPADGLDGERG